MNKTKFLIAISPRSVSRNRIINSQHDIDVTIHEVIMCCKRQRKSKGLMRGGRLCC